MSVPRETANNAYAKFGGTNKEYYGIFRSGLFIILLSLCKLAYQASLSCATFKRILALGRGLVG